MQKTVGISSLIRCRLQSFLAASNAMKLASASASTVSQAESEKFAKLADDWWDPKGPFRPLHQMHPTRCQFIKSTLCNHFNRDPSLTNPLQGLKILDVGCGGGLLSESLAKMGATVLGIDVSDEGIAAATAHASLSPNPLSSLITYHKSTVEDLAQKEPESFDAVIASEVIEHVESLDTFAGALTKLTVPGGGVVVSTINRTLRAYALAIVAAEQILQWVPKGTHDWEKFITPDELVILLEHHDHEKEKENGRLRVEHIAGMIYNPLTGTWYLDGDVGVNYIAFFVKDKKQ
jgi:polyprenyldihydroxybenzoate methyltransferase/3-demethylubiquinol 3-O-methyltransferase